MNGVAAVASPYVGLVREVEERLVEPCDARLPVYTAELAADDRLLGGPLDHVGVASGMAPNHEAAAAAALGEAVERYCLSHLPRERLVEAAAEDLGAAAVSPRRFALFSQRQYAAPRFPFVPFSEATRVAWIDGWNVETGEPAWLPAELVLLADASTCGRRIGYATSNGAACAESETEAVLRGLLELCERDAFMITWNARLSLPLLDWSDDAAMLDLDRRFFAPTGLVYAAVDLSRFHTLPSVLGVVRAPAEATAVVGVGAGTAATAEQAWWKALAEAFGTRTSAAARLAGGAGTHLAAGAPVLTLEDHILAHARPGHDGGTRFLDASPERTAAAAVPPLAGPADVRVAGVAARIAAAGSTAYAVDVTTPDVASIGLCVVKTVAPELCALDVPHPARFLGALRLRTVPAQLGLASRTLREHELNPDPHPFP